jgi:hypothetical protein
MRLLVFLTALVAFASEPTDKPLPVDAKLTSAYWHAAFDASQAQATKEKADLAVQQAADAIKASCAGEIRPEGRDFVCVPKPETK